MKKLLDFILAPLGYSVRKNKLMSPPQAHEIKSATTDVAWEYVMLLGAALEMVKAPGPPINHMAQEVFLVHARNLAEFFCGGIPAFKKIQTPPDRSRDNIYAVDFCSSVGWNVKALKPDRMLVKAVNKTLSHMTYSRDRGSKTHAHFEGYLHLHGTVKLFRQTWAGFLKSAKLEYVTDINHYLGEHTKGWVKLSDFESEFDTRVAQLVRASKWALNQTPDGLVP
jgi:hypothetical protein